VTISMWVRSPAAHRPNLLSVFTPVALKYEDRIVQLNVHRFFLAAAFNVLEGYIPGRDNLADEAAKIRSVSLLIAGRALRAGLRVLGWEHHVMEPEFLHRPNSCEVCVL
jgi:hypothetical protein